VARDITFGVDVWQIGLELDELREAWRLADAGGFDNLWLCDHLLPIVPWDQRAPIFEAWSLIAAMAQATRRVRIGAMVSANTFRHPGVLAKIAATVDHLSGGRLELGIGAGGSFGPTEHVQIGLDFPPTGERIRTLGEACTVIKKLWTEDVADFEGRYYRLAGAIAEPKPLQRPHPPFWIGGDGEKLTLRVVAEHADVWNAIGRNPTGDPGGGIPELTHKLAVLDRHCADVGRDPRSIRRSVQVLLGREGELEGTMRRIEELVRVGFTDVLLLVPPPNPLPRLQLAVREILPHFRGSSGWRPARSPR
jgi:F420-dependent oxidoreductase-like protein